MFGGIAKGAIEAIVKPFVLRLLPDKVGDKKFEQDMEKVWAEAEVAAEAALAGAIKAQLEINKTEAGHRTIFVAGWRPFVGWICATALALMYLVFPIADWGLQLAGREMALPELSEKDIMGILIPLLGLGAYRTYEKAKGVAK